MKISVHRWFQVPGEPCERATHASRSVSLILFQSTPAENVWPPRSNLWSAHSQVSAALFYVQTVCMCILYYPWCGHGSVQTIRRILACK